MAESQNADGVLVCQLPDDQIADEGTESVREEYQRRRVRTEPGAVLEKRRK